MAIAAVGQIRSTADVTDNLAQCRKLVRQAAEGGAKVIFLPEAADYIASSPQESLALAQTQEDSLFTKGLQEAAREAQIDVNVGIHVLVKESAATPDLPGQEDAVRTRLFNRSLWIRADGTISKKATYDKLHLFDYGALKESAVVRPGQGLTPPFDTPVGRVGSLVCFDLRFAEPALALAQPPGTVSGSGGTPAGAEILTYPSAFTVPTGEAHWEVLLRARAIETQSWVVAAAQVGWHNEKRVSYGNSMVVDPWGRVVLRLGGVGDEGSEWAVGFVDIDLGVVERVRREMPLARRTDIYPEIGA
ncbi:related to nitrilase, putitive [Cephalotrichum gorgonifer]|uniref:Related to nitrilase, putitive n=1 Tax=Cephalotrichum gorgonifer TaxID=2041049 RepID=A0AAE8SYF2_9PEZI|nr:related to nitrilase, putitive [Cephalotrichum gorgonifer]